jgi:hypothetical protein
VLAAISHSTTMGLTSANETPRQLLSVRTETPGTPTPTILHDSARKSAATQGIKEHERVNGRGKEDIDACR